MELRVINKTDKELRIEAGGKDCTSMNVPKNEPLQTDTAMAVIYDVNPEQSSEQVDPVLFIKTESSVDPLDVLTEATRGVQRTTNDLIDAHRTGIDA